MVSTLDEIAGGIESGDLVPFLGPGALQGARDPATGAAIPADSESLILAMNNGRPMTPRLMWEFPRAAMDVELKRGRGAVHRFLEATYGEGSNWTRAPLHDWLRDLCPRYVIDINRDTQLQESYRDLPHTLVRGIARMGGSDFRFRIHCFDGGRYHEVAPDAVDTSLPMLFKPLGSPRPDPTYIASDADFVDYITELMGGFAIPGFLKSYRRGRRYLFLGLRLLRDTERMVMSDIVYDAGVPTGYALIKGATDKERRFCDRKGIEILDADIGDLLSATGWDSGRGDEEPFGEGMLGEAGEVGC